jgi:hypothetical protein
VDVVELAAHVCPAGHFGQRGRLPAGALVEWAKAGIAIGLQEAPELGQMRARMLALAIRRVAIDDRRRCPAAIGPFIAQIHP